MIKSMTAFASLDNSNEQFTLSCELRSVNHRFKDTSIKLPEWLRFSEADIRAEISKHIKRGKIECILNFKKQLTSDQHFAINMEAVLTLLETTRAIEEQMQKPQSFSALDILTFPGIQQEPDFDKQAIHQDIITLVQKTLQKMLDARAREGAQLGKLIEERCHRMETFITSAKQRMPVVLEQLKCKLKTRIELICAEPDYERLEQEIVILAQKLDVDEELDRLETHRKEVLNTLKSLDPKGRRLDFLMQEMNREANTLGSKSQDQEMTHFSIELKVLIEQMREQVQNIE
jgi:uncharacterized protein (TIGR00255 family)